MPARRAAPGSRLSRRRLLQAAGAAAGAAALAGPLGACGTSATVRRERVAVVGAGLAGLACAYRLGQVGIEAAVFEARPDRVGGRCYTARGFAGGQVGECGGEYIDTDHRRIRRLAPELGLELEDRAAAFRGQRGRLHGDRIYAGERMTTREVYGDYGEFQARLRALTRRAGGAALDRRTALDAIELAVPGGVRTPLGLAMRSLVASEFGLDAAEIAATNIRYLAADGGGGEGYYERFHVAGGNDQLATRMAAELADGALTMDAPLQALWRREEGDYGMEFGGGVGEVRAERLVLAIPFTTLRGVELDRAGLTPRKLEVIEELGMGTNSKLILQFDQRPGHYGGWNGNLATDHPFLYTWDSSITQAGEAGIVTAFYGGADGAGLDAPEPIGPAPAAVVDETLPILERVAPGVTAGFRGKAVVANWSLDPWARGSYAAFLPGQAAYGPIARRREGGVHFAGEHTSTAYQGYLEGAVESGERAAAEVRRALGA